MREEEVVTRAAYLLFYQRRSSVTSGDGSPQHEWLQQLQSSAVNGIPRTVTSHSLDNLLDSGKSRSDFSLPNLPWTFFDEQLGVW